MNRTLLALLLALTSFAASAAVIDFDDLAGDETSVVADGYQGFNWLNVGTIGAEAYPGSGFANGMTSYANVAFNQGGATASISRAGGFDFLGAYFASAWFDQELSFEGSRNGQLLYATDVSYVIDTLAPQWIALDWRGIDTLTIYNSSGTQWAMDDFTVSVAAPVDVPEPGTLALFGVASAGWLASRRRRQRVHVIRRSIIPRARSA